MGQLPGGHSAEDGTLRVRWHNDEHTSGDVVKMVEVRPGVRMPVKEGTITKREKEVREYSVHIRYRNRWSIPVPCWSLQPGSGARPSRTECPF